MWHKRKPILILGILVVVLIFVLIRLDIVDVTFLNQSASLQSPGGSATLVVLASAPVGDGRFIDFSSTPCCSTLGIQYLASGALFTNDSANGWTTMQASNFLSHTSSVPREPGAPAGTSGTEVTLGDTASLAGFMVQAGSPYGSGDIRPAKAIQVTAYDENNTVIFDQETTTCGNTPTTSSCTPKFIGVKSPIENIAKLQYRILEPYSYSLDDMYFERNVGLLTDVSSMNAAPITFSEFSGSGILTNQLADNDIVFANSPLTGFQAAYANGFITSVSVPVQLPGAPQGIAGTEIIVDGGTAKRIGFFIQQGTPFSDQTARPAADIRLIALDKNNNELFNRQIGTCIGVGGASCSAQFVGLYSKSGDIKKIQIIKESTGFYSIDNLYLDKRVRSGK
tara:strand:+ start:1823 stop:3007 length:1185 start_codon:yes stop_codon:yes gene_type:complete